MVDQSAGLGIVTNVQIHIILLFVQYDDFL